MKTSLRIYDTKTKQVEFIEASDDTSVRIYCCGPTVYRDAHVGNLRTFLLADLVRRILSLKGIPITLVQNITDVGHMTEDFISDTPDDAEDKVLSQARKENKSALDIARTYEDRFHADLALLNISPADHYPRASDAIPLMQTFISALMESGHAYIGSDGSVYFSAQSFPSYGAISGNELTALKPGHRYNYEGDGGKKFHADWALWKSAPQRTEMVWPSPWGVGFPGWHIECSAMSLKFLSGHVDLHLGGIDLRFPHHENERAQSNSYLGYEEAVDRWVHGEHLLFEGRKMSKSAGNVVLVSDVINKGIDPLAIRLCFLENRYRNQMDLTWAALNAADQTIQRWRKKIADWKNDGQVNDELINDFVARFSSACESDLDTPKALQLLRSLERSSEVSPATKAKIFIEADAVLALDLSRSEPPAMQLSDHIQTLLGQRAQARSQKNFDESDRLRDELRQLGISVLDTPTGQTWEVIRTV